MKKIASPKATPKKKMAAPAKQPPKAIPAVAKAPKAAPAAAQAPKSIQVVKSPTATTSKMMTASDASLKATAREITQPRKKPVIRNIYETVGGAPGVPAPDGGGGGESGVLNRDQYEMPAEGGDSTKPGAGAGYVLLGKEDEAAGEGVMEEPPSSKSSYKARRERRRLRLLEEERLTSQTRMVAIGCTVLIVAVVVLAAAGFGIYFLIEARAEKDSRPGALPDVVGSRANATLGREKCKAKWEEEDRQVKYECITVDVPKARPDHTCGVVECSYHISEAIAMEDKTGGYKVRFSPSVVKTVSTSILINDSSFCALNVKTMPEGAKGVCVNGRCDHKYAGRGAKGVWASSFSGRWVDNCDEKYACWDDESAFYWEMEMFFESPAFNRTHCNTAQCPQDEYTSAVVYMQHMECDMTKTGGAGHFCSSDLVDGGLLPMLPLYKCRNCSGKVPHDVKDRFQYMRRMREKLCTDKGYTYSAAGDEESSCSVLCTVTADERERIRLFFPDGAFCEYRQQSEALREEAYCVRGRCFLWKKLGKDVKPMSECLKAKAERRKKRS